MARKDTRPASETSSGADRARTNQRKQRWLIVASGVAVIGVCIALKGYMDAAPRKPPIHKRQRQTKPLPRIPTRCRKSTRRSTT